MGIALWIAAAVAAFVIARLLPLGRRTRWFTDGLVSLGAALLAGLTATALDFGGWKEPDWRAGLFAFLCALAVLGAVRTTGRD